VIRSEHFEVMKKRRGRLQLRPFNVEIDIPALENCQHGKMEVRPLWMSRCLSGPQSRSARRGPHGKLLPRKAPGRGMEMSFANKRSRREYMRRSTKR